jgi:hypothetical protein
MTNEQEEMTNELAPVGLHAFCDMSGVCGSGSNEHGSEESDRVLLQENEVTRLKQELASAAEELAHLRQHMDSQVTFSGEEGGRVFGRCPVPTDSASAAMLMWAGLRAGIDGECVGAGTVVVCRMPRLCNCRVCWKK